HRCAPARVRRPRQRGAHRSRGRRRASRHRAAARRPRPVPHPRPREAAGEGRDRHQGTVALRQLSGLRPRSVSQGILALVPVVIAAIAVMILVFAPGTRVLIAAAASGLVLTTATIWLKDRRDEARHLATSRRLAALQNDVAATGEAELKELSRILYFTGAGPHTKATVGNIRKDLHRVSNAVSRIEEATGTMSLEHGPGGAPSATASPFRRSPAEHPASQPLKHPTSETAAGRIAASVAPDPQRRRRLSALL